LYRFAQVQNALERSFEIFYRLISDLSLTDMYHRIIFSSKNYLFAINKEHYFIFASKPLKQLIFSETNKKITTKKCYELLYNGKKCTNCPMNGDTNTSIIKSFSLKQDKTIVMNCQYEPLRLRTEEDFYGMIVYLTDITQQTLIMDSINEMQKLSNLEVLIADQ
ncbi:hypothetical protein MHK_008457, partial [Candidatus Magnetomorum sp. HK-1]